MLAERTGQLLSRVEGGLASTPQTILNQEFKYKSGVVDHCSALVVEETPKASTIYIDAIALLMDHPCKNKTENPSKDAIQKAENCANGKLC